MALKLSNAEISSCLDELEREFLRIGAEKCNHLQEKSQLSAFLLLGLRAVSLLKGMYPLLPQGILDAYDAVRRAFLESWFLQFEFRMVDSRTEVENWFQKPKLWKANKNKLTEFVKSHQLPDPTFEKDYIQLSELAHPTFQATQNSCVVALSRWNARNIENESYEQQIGKNVAKYSEDFVGLLVREIWLVDAQDRRLIDIHIGEVDLPCCQRVFTAWQGTLGN